MTLGTLPHFGALDDKYYMKDMRRRIDIASQQMNSTAVYVKCKIAYNCSRKSDKSACWSCVFNKGNSTVPTNLRKNNYKAIVDIGRPLSIDGRIREQIDQPIFL
jgi:hypothetical protein